jgi:hypothetical protein
MKKYNMTLVLIALFCIAAWLAPTQAKAASYVKLYEHSGMQGLSYTANYKQDATDTNWVTVDQGGANFKDKCSSVSYKIPAGYRVSLYENTNFGGRAYVLRGTGSVSNLDFMNDKCSSVRWERE